MLQRQLGNLTRAGVSLPNEQLLKNSLPESVELTRARNIPLLLVLPLNIVSFETQLAGINLESAKKAYTFLDPALLLDMRKGLPSTSYFIFDVDDGRNALGVRPDLSETSLGLQERSAMSVAEGLSLLLHHPETLDHHYIQLAGSRIRDRDTGELYVPDFYVFARRVKMKREEPDDADKRWGIPSYRLIGAPQ